MKKELQLRADICEAGSRLWQRGIVCGTEGGITVRLTAKTLITTLDGACLGFLEPRDLVLIDLKRKPKGKRKPTSEIKLHLQVYKQRPDCTAVVHACPPTSTGFTVAGEDVPDNVLPESAVALGSDVFDALYRMETLENVCDIIITARLLGEVRAMPGDAFDKLLKTALNGRLD